MLPLAIIPPGTKVSRQVPVALPAAVSLNGQIQPSEAVIAQAGNRFYVQAASAPIGIQAVRAGNVSATNTFGTAQGQPVQDGFDTLTVKNYTLNPVVALVWVGYDDFIDNQLTLVQTTFAQVAYPTYPLANAAASVAINDLTGTSFTDINGKKWGAIQRVCILIFNVDSGVSLILQNAGAGTGTGPGVGFIYPLTPVRFDFSGNYCLNLGGAPINAIVSEIYNAIPL